MSRYRALNLGSLTAVSAGDPVDVAELEEIGVLVGGTFVGTVSIEVSFDGATFVPHPDFTGKTAPFSGKIGFPVKQVRANCTAYTSGTLVCAGGGRDEG